MGRADKTVAKTLSFKIHRSVKVSNNLQHKVQHFLIKILGRIVTDTWQEDHWDFAVPDLLWGGCDFQSGQILTVWVKWSKTVNVTQTEINLSLRLYIYLSLGFTVNLPYLCFKYMFWTLTFMLFMWRIVKSDRYQDEEDKEGPYYLDQQLNLEKTDHRSDHKFFDCFGHSSSTLKLHTTKVFL